MAKIVEEAGGFKVLEITRMELLEKMGDMGALGICDYCMKPSTTGYYVAVLDQWLCPECFKDFLSRNDPCPDDTRLEDIMFQAYCKEFGITTVCPGAAQ